MKFALEWIECTYLLEIDPVFFEHLGIGQNLDEIDEVPDFAVIFSAIGFGDRKQITEAGHAGPIDAAVDAPVEIDRPAAAAVFSLYQVDRPNYGAPVVIPVLVLAAEILVATDATGRPLLDKGLVAAAYRIGIFLVRVSGIRNRFNRLGFP